MITDKTIYTDKKLLQEWLLYIFNNIPIFPIRINAPDISKNEEISNISTSDLIFLMCSFIEGVAYLNNDTDFSLNCFRIFLNNIFKLKIDKINLENNNYIRSISLNNEIIFKDNRINVNSKLDTFLSLKYIWKKMQLLECDRNDFIFLRKTIKELKFSYIDWNDRDFMIRMIKFSVCKALILYNVTENKKAIKMFKNNNSDNIKNMKLLRIDNKISKEDIKKNEKFLNNNGVYFKNKNKNEFQINNSKIYENFKINSNDRQNMLLRKNKPEMSLEEFATIAVENMKKRDNLDKQIDLKNKYEEINSEDEERIKLKEKDEFNDTKINNIGRIRKIG